MSRRIVGVSIVGALLGVLWTVTASANLIVNGGFEDVPSPGTAAGGGGGWSYYNSADVAGWDGDNIELWGSLGIESYEGQFHAELNAHANSQNQNPDSIWSISQTFDTVDGQIYDLFFAYGSRLGDNQSSNEAFQVKVGDLDFNVSDHVVGIWNTSSTSFVASGVTSTLSFTATGYDRYTYGNFLDDIRVTAAVPEPSIIALFGLGLVGLGFARRRKA